LPADTRFISVFDDAALCAHLWGPQQTDMGWTASMCCKKKKETYSGIWLRTLD
jgi:hypothetical protein